MRKKPIQQFFGEELEKLEEITDALRRAGVRPRVRVAPCNYALRCAAEERKKIFQAGDWYASHRVTFGTIEDLIAQVKKAGFVVNKAFSDNWSHIVVFSSKEK